MFSSAEASTSLLPTLPASIASVANWFAVYTNSRHEKSVARHFTDHEIEHFLPLYKRTHYWAKRKSVVLDLPLFPNYVFVHISLHSRIQVLSAPGVLGIVGRGHVPSPLQDSEIEWLRAGLLANKYEPHPYLVLGERVRIRVGAMQGLEGILVRKKNELRVVMTLELIQRSVAVEVDRDDVEPAIGVPHMARVPLRAIPK